MRLSRGLDQKYNELYVESPVLTEGLSPLILAGDVIATTADYLLVNPLVWWKDAIRGRGSAYYYRNPAPPSEK